MIEQFIQRVATTLQAQQIPYMLIGGQAVLFYGSPRLTQDVDITLGVDPDACTQVLNACQQLQLKPLVEQPDAFAHDTYVLPVADQSSGLRVDFIFSSTLYERQAIERAQHVRMGDQDVCIAALEDVVVHKLVAGRPIDVEDVRVLLAKHQQRIDVAYIRKWLQQFEAVETVETQPLQAFERLHRALPPPKR